MAHMDKQKHYRPQYRSLFWPMILIGVGTTWMLHNIGIFTGENLSVFGKIWPLLLIAIGIDFMFGRKSPSRGASIGLAFVGFFLALMYVGPSIGWGYTVERINTTFDVPLENTEHLRLNIDAGVETVTISPLIDSNNLIEGDIWHVGELIVDVDEDEDSGQTIVAVEEDGFSFNLNFSSDDAGWNFNINPEIPLAVDFSGGVGTTTMNLSDFHLTDLVLDMGVGSLDMTLPEPQDSYTVDISGGVGEVDIDVPDNAAIKAIISTGIGNADLPSNLIQIEGDDGFIGEEGTWQTANFEQAEQTITIIFDGGIGSLQLH